MAPSTMSNLTNSRLERRFSSFPDLAFAECWYWIQKSAGALSCRRLCLRRQGRAKGATTMRSSGLLFEAAHCHFYSALSHAACFDAAPVGEKQQHVVALAAHHKQLQILGGELPGEFREPRRVGRRGDGPHRRPRRRGDASLRTGHPLGPRQRLCSQRGGRLRTRLAFLCGARFRRFCACVSAEGARRLPALGSRRQGAATRSALSPSE